MTLTCYILTSVHDAIPLGDGIGELDIGCKFSPHMNIYTTCIRNLHILHVCMGEEDIR